MQHTIRLNTRYKRIASVFFFHEYYSKKVCRDLLIRPDLDTQMKMQSFGILMKPENNGFIMAMDMSKNFNHRIFSGLLELRFDFKIQNPYFANFTNIPFEVDQYFVFEASSEKKAGFLHSGKHVSASCIQDSNEGGLGGHIQLKLNFNDEWFGKEMETEITPFEYVVNFDNRACYWHYFFKLKNGSMQSAEDFSIVPRNAISEGIEFEAAEYITDGARAGSIKIKSKAAIPLEEKPRFLFELRKSAQPGFQVPYSRILPNGSPRNLKFCTLNNQYITEIFVKL
jgi:hypothetical protein